MAFCDIHFRFKKGKLIRILNKAYFNNLISSIKGLPNSAFCFRLLSNKAFIKALYFFQLEFLRLAKKCSGLKI